jgi:hypothetical protein
MNGVVTLRFLGRFLGITSQDPSISKSDLFHAVKL